MKSTWDRLALVLSLLVILAGVLVGLLIFENMPHLEDEFAYLWQARTIADGKLTLLSPEFPKSFLVPFVIDHQGIRFGKYPPGWPAALALGVRAGIPFLVNPFLGGLAAWLTYRLGKRTLDERAAFLGTLLLASSPLFLIQVGSLLSHIWSLVLLLAFFLFWLDSLEREPGPQLEADAGRFRGGAPGAGPRLPDVSHGRRLEPGGRVPFPLRGIHQADPPAGPHPVGARGGSRVPWAIMGGLRGRPAAPGDASDPPDRRRCSP